MKKSILFLTALSISIAFSGVADSTPGYVTSVTQSGNGDVFVAGEFVWSPNDCSSGEHGFYIPYNHPHRATLISQVMTAKAVGTRLLVRAEVGAANCYLGYPSVNQNAATLIKDLDP